MDSRDFATFLAGAISVFLLFSCVYHRHIRRHRMFLFAVGLFIGGMVITEAQAVIRPVDAFGGVMGGGATLLPSPVLGFLYSFGRWVMYASLPVFFLACSGSSRTFPQCSSCGYDLTGNNSGVCPECGGKLNES